MKVRLTSCTAAAPSSTANLGPGYDVFGLALDALYDRVKITRAAGKDSRIRIKMSDSKIPSALETNSAGLVVKRMMRDFSIDDNLDVVVQKGVPAGYGMGSSAASASAAAVALAGLYNLMLDKNKLVEYAAEGEVASAGVRHYDNVSASVLGGFVVSSFGKQENDSIRFIRLEPPKDLFMVVAVPIIPVPPRKTEMARSVLPEQVSLKHVVGNISGATTIVAGFALGDVNVIARGICNDVIVEPARKRLVPGYDNVRQHAIAAGALAVTISGAGPAMIAFLKGKVKRKQIEKAMEEGFMKAGIRCQTFACGPSKGAHLI